jgi:glycerol-3-phosphate dehydrogenase
VSDYFRKPVTPADVVWTYSGVRPLYDDGASEAQAATRDYVLERDAPAGGAPRITVYGGKITTYRRLAEAVLGKLAPDLPAAGRQAGWTARAPLPGGDFATDGRPALETKLIARHPALTPTQARRLIAAYGTRAFDIATAGTGFGRDFGSGLSEAEVRFLVATEWAQSSDDILWRRSKLGLRMAPHEVAALDAFLAGMGVGQPGDGRTTPADETGGRAA